MSIFISCDKNTPETTPILPRVTFQEITIPEGDEQYFIDIIYEVFGDRINPVTFSYITKDGSAQAENDYVPIYGDIVYGPGNQLIIDTFQIKILGNKIPEEDEYFDLVIDPIENATIDTSNIRITILDDDIPHDTFPGYISPETYEGYKLVWSDEFNIQFYEGYWTLLDTDGCPDKCGFGNNELQYYRPENAKVDNGLLTITAREENYFGHSYTSARMNTKDKIEVRYGRIDIRARLPEGKGIWPALWMMGANRAEVGWPEAGEIDIMELRGSTPYRSCGTVHYQNANGNHANPGAKCFNLYSGRKYSDEFHVFSLVWDEEKIQWFLDDSHAFNTVRYTDLNLGSNPNPFLKPFYFLMNVAVGGNYDGSPDDTTVFPQTMEVDYIRVFQKL